MGWRVYTIGLIGLTSDVNETLLQEIASVTGGEYFPVTTEEAARNAITEIYKQINRTVNKTEQTIHQEEISILPGEVYNKTFEVAPGTESLWVDRIIPGSDVEMSLTRPDGTVIDRTTQNPDVYHALGATYEIYRISLPMAGTWTMTLKGTDVPAEGEPTSYSIAVTGGENLPDAPGSSGDGADDGEGGGAGDTNNCFINTLFK